MTRNGTIIHTSHIRDGGGFCANIVTIKRSRLIHSSQRSSSNLKTQQVNLRPTMEAARHEIDAHSEIPLRVVRNVVRFRAYVSFPR